MTVVQADRPGVSDVDASDDAGLASFTERPVFSFVADSRKH
jgi:hypothetical protein